jgi:hypothetical protein
MGLSSFGWPEMIVAIAVVIAVVVSVWVILTRLGFSPLLAILTLVPIANLILLIYVALADWPAYQKRGADDQKEP